MKRKAKLICFRAKITVLYVYKPCGVVLPAPARLRQLDLAYRGGQ